MREGLLKDDGLTFLKFPFKWLNQFFGDCLQPYKLHFSFKTLPGFLNICGISTYRFFHPFEIVQLLIYNLLVLFEIQTTAKEPSLVLLSTT